MRPQATHSRWLQRGHLQWVLKSPWWQRLQQPAIAGLSSILAGPWPADHGREQGQRGLGPQAPFEVLTWEDSRQGWGKAGAVSTERPPQKDSPLTDTPTYSTVSRKNLPPHPCLQQAFPGTVQAPSPGFLPQGLRPGLRIRNLIYTTFSTSLHPHGSLQRDLSSGDFISEEEILGGGHPFPHPETDTRLSLVGARMPASK